jgi:hypothetical protein
LIAGHITPTRMQGLSGLVVHPHLELKNARCALDFGSAGQRATHMRPDDTPRTKFRQGTGSRITPELETEALGGSGYPHLAKSV